MQNEEKKLYSYIDFALFHHYCSRKSSLLSLEDVTHLAIVEDPNLQADDGHKSIGHGFIRG